MAGLHDWIFFVTEAAGWGEFHGTGGIQMAEDRAGGMILARAEKTVGSHKKPVRGC